MGRKAWIAIGTLATSFFVSSLFVVFDKMSAAEWVSLQHLIIPTVTGAYMAANVAQKKGGSNADANTPNDSH